MPPKAGFGERVHTWPWCDKRRSLGKPQGRVDPEALPGPGCDAGGGSRELLSWLYRARPRACPLLLSKRAQRLPEDSQPVRGPPRVRASKVELRSEQAGSRVQAQPTTPCFPGAGRSLALTEKRLLKDQGNREGLLVQGPDYTEDNQLLLLLLWEAGTALLSERVPGPNS